MWNVAQIKVLGIYLNPKNNFSSNIARARSNAFLRLNELKPLLENVPSIPNRRIIVSSSVISILRYCASLYCGQNNEIIDKFHTSIMRCYRVIYNQSTYMTRCEKICLAIKMPMPRELVVKDASNFIHRLLLDRRPVQLHNLLRFPNRETRITVPQIRDRPNTERSRRGSFNVMLKNYSTINATIRGLSKEAFRSIISRSDFNILPIEDQRN